MEWFEIFLKQDYIMWNLWLYFVERRNWKTFVWKPVDIIMEEIDESSYSKPTITFLRWTEDLFIEAIKKYLDTKWIKLNEENKTTIWEYRI